MRGRDSTAPGRMRTALVPAAFALACAVAAAMPAGAADRVLRVCADPNNLPFSNDAEEGFENKIAAVLAAELDARVAYTWWAQRRGFVRHTLGAELCDLIVGVPAGYELVDATRPYYRSTYVFVYRAADELELESILDERLRELSIGVHLTGDDGTNPPPAHALGARGIVDNVVGYMIYGDYRESSPIARPVTAVAAGEIDVAAVWGPVGGYFARRSSTPLAVRRIADTAAFSGLPFEFSIAMGVRRGNGAFKQEIEAAIANRSAEIAAILRDYGVPLIGTSIADTGTDTLETLR